MGLRGHHRSIASSVQTVSFLVVRFGNRYCAVPADGVRGVLTREEAGTEETVMAVGVTYHDVDLASRLSTAVDVTDPDIRTVLYSNGHTHGAFRVEEVIGMIDVERTQCRPLPPHFQQEERTWISGTVFFRNELALIVNPEWVLGELGEEMSSHAKMAGVRALTASVSQGGQC